MPDAHRTEDIAPYPLFVYGTLRPGEKNYGAYLAGHTLQESPAWIQGELYFVTDGGYPYIIPGTGRVRGEVITIDPARYNAVLHSVDILEEFDPANEQFSVYVRRPVLAVLEDGRTMTAWTYFWNCPDRMGTKISSGDFKQRSAR